MQLVSQEQISHRGGSLLHTESPAWLRTTQEQHEPILVQTNDLHLMHPACCSEHRGGMGTQPAPCCSADTKDFTTIKAEWDRLISDGLLQTNCWTDLHQSHTTGARNAACPVEASKSLANAKWEVRWHLGSTEAAENAPARLQFYSVVMRWWGYLVSLHTYQSQSKYSLNYQQKCLNAKAAFSISYGQYNVQK